jgi:hypothetical protein
MGSVLGAAIVGLFRSESPSFDTVHAKQIIVDGKLGFVSLDGDHGISLSRYDYAMASLSFHEPGTGDPGTGGPTLWIVGKEPQAFKASPAGYEMAPIEQDESDGP